MLKIKLLASAAFILASCLFSPTAHATNMPNENCNHLGTTLMSDDRASILACLLATGTTGATPPCINNAGAPTGNCKWKSTTSGGSDGIGQCYVLVPGAPSGVAAIETLPSGLTANDIATLTFSQGYHSASLTCKSGWKRVSCEGWSHNLANEGAMMMQFYTAFPTGENSCSTSASLPNNFSITCCKVGG